RPRVRTTGPGSTATSGAAPPAASPAAAWTTRPRAADGAPCGAASRGDPGEGETEASLGPHLPPSCLGRLLARDPVLRGRRACRGQARRRRHPTGPLPRERGLAQVDQHPERLVLPRGK